jgi:uncharacterized membrane protein YraQ (UPF0718 family)
MIKKYKFIFVGIISIILFTTFYYYFDFSFAKIDVIALTISTFLFAIFLSFFITRQSSRYSTFREILAEYDGHMTNVYKNFGHIDERLQKECGEYLKRFYKIIINNDLQEKENEILVDTSEEPLILHDSINSLIDTT